VSSTWVAAWIWVGNRTDGDSIPADEQKHKVEAKDTRKGKGNPRNN